MDQTMRKPVSDKEFNTTAKNWFIDQKARNLDRLAAALRLRITLYIQTRCQSSRLPEEWEDVLQETTIRLIKAFEKHFDPSQHTACSFLRIRLRNYVHTVESSMFKLRKKLYCYRCGHANDKPVQTCPNCGESILASYVTTTSLDAFDYEDDQFTKHIPSPADTIASTDLIEKLINQVEDQTIRELIMLIVQGLSRREAAVRVGLTDQQARRRLRSLQSTVNELLG